MREIEKGRDCLGNSLKWENNNKLDHRTVRSEGVGWI
jgi:hypothetical protein